MNRNTEKLLDIERGKNLLYTLKSELTEFKNIDICIALEKCIFDLESIEV